MPTGLVSIFTRPFLWITAQNNPRRSSRRHHHLLFTNDPHVTIPQYSKIGSDAETGDQISNVPADSKQMLSYNPAEELHARISKRCITDISDAVSLMAVPIAN